MSKNEKAIAKMRENQTGWRIEDLQAIAHRQGIAWRHDGGSHCVFIAQSGKTLPVPAKKPIKPIYIKKFLLLMEDKQ